MLDPQIGDRDSIIIIADLIPEFLDTNACQILGKAGKIESWRRYWRDGKLKSNDVFEFCKFSLDELWTKTASLRPALERVKDKSYKCVVRILFDENK